MYNMFNYIFNLIFPPQPLRKLAFGFRWVAQQGVPAQLSICDLTLGCTPGINVIFTPEDLGESEDIFGRLGHGPVFAAPGAPSAAVTAIVDQMRANPLPNYAEAFDYVTPQRLADISGYLEYTAGCLDSINLTAAGAELLLRLNSGGTVTIRPAGAGNTTFVFGDYVNRVTAAIRAYGQGEGFDATEISTLVNQRYPGINPFDQLAIGMNSLPLASLFTAYNPQGPGFLADNFNFQGQAITGQDLMTWLSPAGFPAFDTNLRTFMGVVNGINVREYFLLALNILLYPVAPRGNGESAGIKFVVRNDDENDLVNPGFRPPAVGLAHELVHAMHYFRGTAAGTDVYHFTTTAAEMLFTGLGPFVNEPITENRIRLQWNTIPLPSLHPSNVWAVPAQRLVYEAPVVPDTPEIMRDWLRVI